MARLHEKRKGSLRDPQTGRVSSRDKPVRVACGHVRVKDVLFGSFFSRYFVRCTTRFRAIGVQRYYSANMV